MYASSGHGWSPLCRLARIVVMPWRTKFSCSGKSGIVVWMCAWLSMKPGATIRPRASSTSAASTAARPSGATRTMRSPAIATSARYRDPPVPSTTVPPRMTTSYTGG